MPDYGDMTCDECRVALSARLDGEDDGSAPSDVHAHFDRCAACRTWYDEAAAVTRMARTTSAGEAIDVTDAVVAAAPSRNRVPSALVLRVALAIVAMAQLVIGALQLIGIEVAADHIHLGSLAGDHSGSESAAWDIAIGAGFLWIAARRGRPTGVLPILTVFVAVLVVLNVTDLINGRTDLAHVAVHSFVAVGYVIVLAMMHPAVAADRPPPGRSHGGGSDNSTESPDGARIRQLPRPRPTFQRRANEARRAA